MELSKFCEIMGGIMENQDKEIIIKAVKVEDSKIGPRVGICDMEGHWYNSTKKSCAGTPGSWDILASLQKGERVHIYWKVRSYEQYGATKYTNDIIGLEKVQRTGDEVVRLQDAGPSATPPSPVSPQVDMRQEMSPKQTCVKSATDLVVALLAAGAEMENPMEEIMLKARYLYGELKEVW